MAATIAATIINAARTETMRLIRYLVSSGDPQRVALVGNLSWRGTGGYGRFVPVRAGRLSRLRSAHAKGRSPDKDPGLYLLVFLVQVAEDEDLSLHVPVDGVRVVEEVPQHLGIVRGGHDQGLLGPVVQD